MPFRSIHYAAYRFIKIGRKTSGGRVLEALLESGMRKTDIRLDAITVAFYQLHVFFPIYRELSAAL
jgi:hypothetical protein